MTAPVALLTTNLARGGAETQVAQLAVGLRGRGWPVTVISLLPPSAFEHELVSSHVAVFSLGMQPGVPNPLAFIRLARILRKLRPGILHSHMFHANVLARAARLVCPVPVLISTAHSVVESGRHATGAQRREWLYRLTDWLADQTVAVCEAGAARYAVVGAAPRGKLRVIPNAVDTSRFRPDAGARAEARRRLGIGGEFVWLAVGRLMWKKDYGSMLRAFAGQSEALLLIAGAGPQESELRELAGRLRANVRFLGLRSDVAELMAAADAFVMSSLVEGLPVVLLEAAASGLPCVATSVGGAAEAVLHERTGYVVPPGDPAALASAMLRLASMPLEERRRMSQAARTHAAERFELNIVLDRWEQLYRELLERACRFALEPGPPE